MQYMKRSANLWPFFAGAALIFLAVSRSTKITSGTVPACYLTEHFSLAEVEHSNEAISHNINNKPPAWALANAVQLAVNVLEPVRNYLGLPLIVNSWYRSPAVNVAVGGSDDSDHMRALAADVTTGNKSTNAAIIRAALALDLPFDQLIIYDSQEAPSRVHLSYEPGQARQQIKFKDASGYTSIDLDAARLFYL